MSLDNFIPKVWSSRLLKQLDKNHVFVSLCNREYEGDIGNVGDTVKINSIGDITVNSYVKNSTSISPETLSDAATFLEVDQSNYFAFEVDDIDQAQQKPKVMQRAMDKAAIGLADEADSYIAGLYGDAGLSPSEEDWSSTIDIQSAAGKIKQNLWEQNVPTNANLWWVVNPEIYHDALQDVVSDLTDNVQEFRSGAVGSIYGIDIYVSNNLTGDGTNGSEFQTMAGTMDAIAYVEQINKVEGYRPEDGFTNAVKGLHVYGAKVIRPEQLVSLPVQTS